MNLINMAESASFDRAEKGVEEARRQAITKHERVIVEAAYQVLH